MKDAPRALAVIPARYDSSRFPGKALALLAGKPMVQHVVERARQAARVARVLVATDDERIRRAVEELGGEAVLTRREHRSGTERVAEVAAQVAAPIYLNVQGDEPLIDPAALDELVGALEEDPAVEVATLATPLADLKDVMDPNIVKVVFDFEANALYFSRAPIPWMRDASAGPRHFKHRGVYAFRRKALLEFPTLPPGELERREQLEQLRWLENGWRIRVAETSHDAVSVDVPEDLARAEKLLAAFEPNPPPR
jgi:3-deoxy-manno-octulosonate cytidylyltransferase (CMP-KDO synthetase)